MTVEAYLRVTFYGEQPVVVERFPCPVTTQPAAAGEPALIDVPGLGAAAVGLRDFYRPRAALKYDYGLFEDLPCKIGDHGELLTSIYLDWVVLVVNGYPT